MSKAKTQTKSEKLEDKYDGITVTDYWHSNGDIDLTLIGKGKVLELYTRLPAVYKRCQKIGITNQGYVAYQNPIGDVIFYPVFVTPSNVQVGAKTWWVERDRQPERSHMDHPVGDMWFKSPE